MIDDHYGSDPSLNGAAEPTGEYTRLRTKLQHGDGPDNWEETIVELVHRIEDGRKGAPSSSPMAPR